MTPYYQDDSVTLYAGDCLDVLRTLPEASVDAVVTDPPYGLEFMGKDWDGADGFRRSLNAADVGRDNAFGRTSARAPEYNTGRGARVKRERASELTPTGEGHSTSAGPYLAAGVDSVRVAGPPFQEWCEAWAREALRVLKPGGYMLTFGGSRTWHRLACAVEDAGFEIRDSIAWLYGSGFPKSLDVAKAIDKTAGHWRGRAGSVESDNGSMSGANYERTDKGDPVTAAAAAAAWHGWGTSLKPAFEPIVVGRKPLIGTVAANVQQHGTGALNIDACRVSWGADGDKSAERKAKGYSEAARKALGSAVAAESSTGFTGDVVGSDASAGRWPTNVVLDDTQAAELDQQTGVTISRVGQPRGAASGDGWGMTATGATYGDSGGASRFFPTFRYEPKAGRTERPRGDDGTAHPTVKPIDLMRWLVRLVTPPGGLVLEPFAGSGTTLEACIIEGFHCIGIERDETYLPLIVARLSKPIQPDMFGAVS